MLFRSAGRGVPVTIARQGQVVRPQAARDAEEEAPTTLMPHGSGGTPSRLHQQLQGQQHLPAAADEDPEPESLSPAAFAPPPQQQGVGSSRFATYLIVTVIGVALLVFLITNGLLG